jgi:hypothetical protein
MRPDLPEPQQVAAFLTACRKQLSSLGPSAASGPGSRFCLESRVFFVAVIHFTVLRTFSSEDAIPGVGKSLDASGPDPLRSEQMPRITDVDTL